VVIILGYFAGGCEVAPTPEQIEVGRQYGVKLGTGYSSGIYPATFEQVVEATTNVMEEKGFRVHNLDQLFVGPEIGRPTGIIKGKHIPSDQREQLTALGYLGSWDTGWVGSKGNKVHRVYNLIVFPRPTTVNLECFYLDPIAEDYDRWIILHKAFQEKLGVKCYPISIAEVGVSDKNAQLIIAAKDGDLPAVQNLLTNDALVNAKNYGATALWMAAEEGHTEIVRLLLERGADANTKEDISGFTALMSASVNGHTEIVALLLEKGADLNAKATSNGTTALIMAAEEGHMEVVKLLLSKNADVKVKRTTDGVTALSAASRKGHMETVELLEKAGAKE
jgi:hypothetical protein